MNDARKFGGFLGAMAAFSPSFIIGTAHYAVSIMEGKDNKTASSDFDRTFNRLYRLGENIGARLAVGTVSLGSEIFGSKTEK